MKKNFFKALFSIVLFIGTTLGIKVLAMSSIIDPGFTTGIPIGFNVKVTTQAIQNDGKVIIGGRFTTYQGTTAGRIIRVNADGSIDPSFNIGDGFDDDVYSIAIQSDGKILVGGYFYSYDGISVSHLARLNNDGSLDTGFIASYFNSYYVNTISLQDDGKILVGLSNDKMLVRLNNDGTLDSSFYFTGSLLTCTTQRLINAIAVQDDGKILVGGRFQGYNGTQTQHILRLNSDGTLDSGFDTRNGFLNGGNRPTIRAIKIQNDGKVIVGGYFETYSGSSSKYIARLNSDGTLDNSFAIGNSLNQKVLTLALQSDGKIIVGGEFYSYDGTVPRFIARLNIDGTLDNSFSVGDGFTTSVLSIVLGANGKILVGGTFTEYDGLPVNYEVALTNSGIVDTNFNLGDGFSSQIRTSAIQNDGKILIAGDFKSYKGDKNVRYITRLNSDGSLDDSFTQRTGDYPDVKEIIIQNDGKILIGQSPVLRLNSDGSLDDSFSAKPVNFVDMALQNDGKILFGGDFWTYSGVRVNGIVRINSDGSFDTGFNTGSGFQDTIGGNMGQVRSLETQNDGKILIGGNFNWYNGTTNLKRMVRLNPNGTIDTGFNIGGGFNASVKNIKVQNDGKILVGGDFSTYSGVAVKHLIRLNSNGSLDTGFIIGNEFTSSSVENIIIATGGMFVFGKNGGTDYFNQLVYINNSGAVDTGFNLGDIGIYTASSSPDGSVFLGGSFTTYGGVPAGYITKLYGTTELVVLPDSSDENVINAAFTSKGYTQASGDLIGITPISLQVINGLIPTNLSLTNENINLYIDTNTQFIKEGLPYNGIISVPILKNITSVNNEKVITSFAVGSITENISLTGGLATLKIPLSANIAGPVNIYYSNDNGAKWYLESTASIVDNIVTFSTNHLTNFAITEAPDTTAPVGTISYSTTTSTTNSVTATLSLNETGTITNNDGDNTYTFADNGSFTFEFTDTAGNTGSATATVSWITKQSSNGGGGSSRHSPITNIIDKIVDTIKGPAETIGNIKDSPYTTEMNNAYLWAYKMGITAKPSIQEANIDGKLYRSHLAKMISEYAVKELKKVANTGAKCEFTDMDNQSTEMKIYAQAACQLGLMGLKSDGTPDTKFNPTAQVTRAQFGTTLSRLLYGTSNNENVGGERYTSHLNALKKAGIMNKIENPTMDELRGNVFLMLMRAVK